MENDDMVEMTIYLAEKHDGRGGSSIHAHGWVQLSLRGHIVREEEPFPEAKYAVKVCIPKPVAPEPVEIKARSVTEIRVVEQD